jgi:hypothetical protein
MLHQLDYEFTDKEISPWGGLRFVHELHERCGLKQKLIDIALPIPGSNRGYQPNQIIEGFLVSVILGAKRFAHSGTIRHDEVISKIFGWEKGMASESTFTRFFRQFSTESNDFYMTRLNKWWFKNIEIEKHTIDIDSSIITRYGEQEGVEVGYNPKKHGRASHHPIIAFSAEAKMVIQAWMRTGNSVSSTEFSGLFEQVKNTLPKEKIGLIRADSGFSSPRILGQLEGEGYNYIVAAKMYEGLVSKIFDQKNWQKVSKGIECCSFQYQLPGWDTSRRIVVARKNEILLPESGGKTLFPEYERFAKYRYSAFITNMDLSAELIWSIYKKRADAENQIKELKYNYGMEGFCSESFSATEAAFRWVMVAYNLMSLFKQKTVTTKSIPTLSSLRFQCIAIGSYIITKGRKEVLKLAVKESKRDFYQTLFKKLNYVTHSTA